MDGDEHDEAAAPLFRLELLPDAARDRIFALLRVDEAARACCVSRAWRSAFSGAAVAHLRAELTFDSASFGPLDVVSPTLVFAAVTQAGPGLRTLRAVPWSAVKMLPGLARALPGLRSVTLDGALGIEEEHRIDALAVADAVPELHVEIDVDEHDFCLS